MIKLSIVGWRRHLTIWGRSISQTDSDWFPISCHGEWVEIQSLKRKGPDLGDVRNPTALVKLMRDKEYQVTANEISTPNGKVVEVKVPERELSLMFVTSEVRHQSGRE